MGLNSDTQYKNYAGAIGSAIQAAYKYGEPSGRVSPKAVNVEQFKPLAGQVNSTQPAPSQYTGNLGTETTKYGGQTRSEKYHPGTDIANVMGTKIPSFTGGNVTEVVGGKTQGSPGGYGNYVIVQDEQGNKHRYSHLSNSYVAVGSPVTRGMALGEMGNTGNTYSLHGGDGTHLDYRIRDMYNNYISPYAFINPQQ